MAVAALALCLASSFVLTRYLAHVAEREHPKLGTLVDAAGLRLHCVERGKGQPVVFLHGTFGAVQDFTATVFDPTALRYRAIAIDRPGHGYSERPRSEVCTPAVQARWIHAALRELDVERPILVGFSYGAMVALAYAIDHPDDTGGLVIVNGVSHDWPGTTSWIYDVVGVPLFGNLLVNTILMPLGTWTSESSIERAFDPQPVPSLFHASPITLELRPSSFLANAEDMRVLKAAVREQSEHYRALKMPLAIVISEHDRIVSPTQHSYPLRDKVAGSVLISVPDGGHQILYTHPRIVLRAIDTVAERIAERGARR